MMKKWILFNQNSETDIQGSQLVGMLANYMMIAVLGILISNNFTLFAQTQWTKVDSVNPILEEGPAGSWDDDYLMEPCVIFNDGIYQMWYGGNDESISRIGYATSTYKVNWIKYAGNPVLDLGLEGSWDDESVNHPFVIFDGTAFKMWYRGNDGTTSHIGCAVSDDGMNWTKVDSVNPVLTVGPVGSWDDTSVSVPVIFKLDTTYLMWYAGGDGNNIRIGLAASPDGIHWTKDTLNPVINIDTSWESNGIYPESVLYDGTVFQMWYGALNSAWTGRTGYATSPDGVEWTKHPNPVLDLGSPGDWDDENAWVGTVMLIDNIYHMWYENGDASTFGKFGYATDTGPVAITDRLDLIPTSFVLHQNYPNPFNPITTIHYDLPEQSHVNITVYDLLGRRVKTLINQTQDAGYRSIIWDATNKQGQPVSSGLYFYQIEARQKEVGQVGDFILTQKMVLLR